jgi:nitroreductase
VNPTPASTATGPPSTDGDARRSPEAIGRRAPLDDLLKRRSIKALAEPGPTDAQLDTILLAATTVPDHGNLRPWRFIVVSGDERPRFGDALVAAGIEGDPDLPEAARAKLHGKAFVAPTFVVIVSSPKPGNVARWEQEASAAAAGYAMALAAHLLGVGAIWKSAPMRTGTALAELLSLTDDEQLMGWVNLGTEAAPPRERDRSTDLADVASRLDGGEVRPWQT